MTQLEELLVGWIPRQRWFAGKGVPIEKVMVEAEHTVVTGETGLRLLVVNVGQRDCTSRYQVLLGLRPEGTLRSELSHAVIGVCELPGRGLPCTVYDAAHDSELMSRLLEHIAEGAGDGSLRSCPIPGTVVRTGLRSLVLTGEQSNTSVIYGEDYVLKIFRRLWPGYNPDLELNAALAGSPFVSPPHGWIETDLSDQGRPVPTTLAMLQEYLRTATDGWVLAATSVRDLYAEPATPPGAAGGDFAGEAERLGAATAAVHQDLARQLPTDVLSRHALRELARSMNDRLRRAAEEVPQLKPYTGALGSAFSAFAEVDEPLPVQRVHGDYHLGQVVRTDTGWVLLDFEGEPAAPIGERQRLSSPLRDVAGMLRSFDYAARYQLIGNAYEDELAPVARAWARRNREAFCAGYAFGGGVDPEKHQVMLRAFEYDKAVYEVMYESRNRPSWLRIPLDSIAALAV
ncbi:maltokinase N-terminal cap-like domain-containing protein [Allosalinactinospora lopnorensis]|uniref:maltokinase N-terminal cap-like domain-containing protein n=1 Tax=Allosalinactinospora lopnorensis TaxID=1352348 RepID=UPI000623ED9D|nr:phosphotransferase [Allosalinactinospora lopnorensis]